jgi:hypothetical protein
MLSRKSKIHGLSEFDMVNRNNHATCRFEPSSEETKITRFYIRNHLIGGWLHKTRALDHQPTTTSTIKLGLIQFIHSTSGRSTRNDQKHGGGMYGIDTSMIVGQENRHRTILARATTFWQNPWKGRLRNRRACDPPALRLWGERRKLRDLQRRKR